MDMCASVCVCGRSRLKRRSRSFLPRAAPWPLHDIAIANIVWCMAYIRGSGWGLYVAQQPCNSIATVWAMQAGRKNERTIDLCAHD